MEINEIKKSLYREKPVANIEQIKKDGIFYSCKFNVVVETLESRKRVVNMDVFFCVPLDDIGEAIFLNEMPAQLLIRYLISGDPAF